MQSLPLSCTVSRADLSSRTALDLIGALNAELSARYPEEGACHFRLDLEEVAEGRGAFLIAFLGDEPAGCGAVRRLDDHTAEIKRMFVQPRHRGRGLGRQIVSSLLAEAKKLNVSRVVLETGVRQAEAIALYLRSGFTQIPAFGEYLDSPLSICMARDI